MRTESTRRESGESLTRSAEISEDGLYRYHLGRVWNRSLRSMVWIMLNPSVADADVDDMTIRKCMAFSRRLGCGSIDVINLYSLRATQPKHLLDHPDPEGPENRTTWNSVMTGRARFSVMAAWGASAPKGLPGSVAMREWMTMAPQWLCLGQTEDGSPRHPSRLGYDAARVGQFTPRGWFTPL